MKRKIAVLLAAFSLSVGILSGCGSNKNNTNTAEGMNRIQQMDYNGALTCFEAALENRENERLIYRGMGLAYMGLTDYEQAIEHFNTCLQLSDGRVQDVDFDVNYYLAAAYYKNGNAQEAEEAYSAILALRGDEVDAYYFRGASRLKQQDYENAKKDFEQVLKLTSGNCNRLIEIYQVLEENGYQQIGQEYLQDALSKKGEQMKAYDKGRIYYYLRDYVQACRYLEEAKDNGLAESYLYLGRAYEATGDYNYAASVYTGYVANDTTNAEIYNQLGLCRMKQGEYALALEAFQSAMNIENNGMMQTLQFNEIVAYEYLGEYRKAAVLMDNYVKMYPDDEKAKREYEFLKTR